MAASTFLGTISDKCVPATRVGVCVPRAPLIAVRCDAG
jgi:hypothetical protein